jgi:F-type H+-transporting ATPase subunit epsilon
MKCVAVTPEKTVVDRDVKFVVVPLYDGEFGIGAGRSRVIGRLGAGEMRLTLDDDSVESWYVEGGFVEAANDTVSLLTNHVCKMKDLSVEDAENALQEALKLPSNSHELAEVRAEAIHRARAKLRAALKAQNMY